MKLTCHVNPSVQPPVSFLETSALYAWNTYEIVMVSDVFRSDANPVTLTLSSGDLSVSASLVADAIHADWRVGVLLLTDSLFQTLFDTLNAGHESDSSPQAYTQAFDFTLLYNEVPIVTTTVPVILTSQSSSSTKPVVVDLALDSSSVNPVQNKAIYAALAGKQDNLGVTLATEVLSDEAKVPTSKAVYDLVHGLAIPSAVTVATSVVSGNTNPVSSGAVYQFLYNENGGLNNRVVTLETAYSSLKSGLDTKASTSVASDTQAGLMSASDYTKLQSISESATDTVVDNALNAESGNAIMNKVVKTALDDKQKNMGITAIDTGSLTASNTVVPSSELVSTLLAAKADALSIDTTDFSDSDEKVPSSKLVKTKLGAIVPFDYTVDKNALTITDETSIPCSKLVKSLLDDKQGLLTIDKTLTTSDSNVPSSNAVNSAVNTLTTSLANKIDASSILSAIPNSVDNKTVLGSKFITELIATKQKDLSLEAVDIATPLSAVDTRVPSSKIVASELEKKVDKSSIVSEFGASVTTDDTYVPSAKLVKSMIDTIQPSSIRTVSSYTSINASSLSSGSTEVIALSPVKKNYMLALNQQSTSSVASNYYIDFDCSSVYQLDSSGNLPVYFLDFYFVVYGNSLLPSSTVSLTFGNHQTSRRWVTLSLSGGEVWSLTSTPKTITSNNIDGSKVTLTIPGDSNTNTLSDATIIHFLGFPTVGLYNLYGSIVRKGSTHTITISS